MSVRTVCESLLRRTGWWRSRSVVALSVRHSAHSSIRGLLSINRTAGYHYSGSRRLYGVERLVWRATPDRPLRRCEP